MLQLTFHALCPCPVFTAMAHDAYLALKQRGDARLRDGCLSITLSDLGPSERTRYRLVFECAGATGSSLRVVTQAANMHAALRSGCAVMLGSSVVQAVRAARTSRPAISIPAQEAFARAV